MYKREIIVQDKTYTCIVTDVHNGVNEIKGGDAMELTLRRTAKQNKDEYIGLIEEIREVEERLAFTEKWFSLESDQDLIDACIYERESLYARYRYLIGLARKNGVSHRPF